MASLTPETRASLFHATVFVTGGVIVAYFPVWMTDLGLSDAEIGMVNALPLFLVLVSSVLVGRLADRASDWKVVITWLALIAGLASFALPLVTGFWGVLLVFALCQTPVAALGPVLDAATIRMTQRRGSSFGAIRAWGTVGFVLSAAAAGPAIKVLGAGAFIPLFIAASLLRAGMALQLPNFRAPSPETAPRPKSNLRALLRPWFLLPLLAFALINATHFFLGYMGALIWKLDGIGSEWFGPLAAYSAVGEAVTMFLWTRLNLRLSARSLLMIACVVGVVRYVLMAQHPGLLGLFALQTLHAITFPFSYFGLVQFVANWTPEENAAEAQGFANMLAQGATVLTFLSFGALLAIFGTGVYLVAAGMCAVGCVAVWISLKLKPAHS